MAWLVPENMLDDQQRQFVENVDIDRQNVWIKGFPGSGKSVLLAYTMKKIKRRDANAKVAVVVFTHSLIAMFKAALSTTPSRLMTSASSLMIWIPVWPGIVGLVHLRVT